MRADSLQRVCALFPVLAEKMDAPAGALSGGQQQMVAIGRALMARPRFLLLDEPSLGLSPLIVRELFRAIREINAEGVAVLLVEQNVAAALELARRAYVLDEGRIAAEGEPRQLMSQPRNPEGILGTPNGLSNHAQAQRAHATKSQEGQSVLQAGLDAGHMMPYSCRAGVCRTCRGTILEGKVDYGLVHETYLPESDKAKGYALLCQAKPLSDLVIEVREVQGVRPRIIPCRVEKLEKPAPDVAVIGLRLPMNENFRFLAGQYIDFLLKDGKRRSYSLATRPDPGGVTALEIHVRHTPGGVFTDHVFDKLKVQGPAALRGPARQLLSARRLEQADRDGGERHRLRADQGDRPARPGEEDFPSDHALLGRAA
mgnify:CR=1 FL=1